MKPLGRAKKYTAVHSGPSGICICLTEEETFESEGAEDFEEASEEEVPDEEPEEVENFEEVSEVESEETEGDKEEE